MNGTEGKTQKKGEEAGAVARGLGGTPPYKEEAVILKSKGADMEGRTGENEIRRFLEKEGSNPTWRRGKKQQRRTAPYGGKRRAKGGRDRRYERPLEKGVEMPGIVTRGARCRRLEIDTSSEGKRRNKCGAVRHEKDASSAWKKAVKRWAIGRIAPP